MKTSAANTPDVFLTLPITPGLLWLIFVIACVVFAIISWMFVHHWKYYGIAENNRIFVQGVYFVIGGTLFVLMGLFIGAYTFIK